MSKKYPLNLDGVCDIPNKSGIYVIKCSSSKAQYIGSSKRCRNRVRSHLSALLRDKHHSISLQRSWNKYGQNKFTIGIVLFCKKSELLLHEQKYLDLERLKNKSYNICFVAGNCAGVRQSEATKEKRAAKLRGAKRTPEQCARISAARKKVGITPEHQLLLNSISKKRAFRLTKEQARDYAFRHLGGEQWEVLSMEAGCNPKAFRREIKKHVKSKYLLKPKHFQPNTVGSYHPMAKLSDTDALNVFNSLRPNKELALKYGITPGHVYDIKHKRCWKILHG